MCVIAVSGRGMRQPTASELETMFNRNPDGAGYMVARAGQVEIHKGFMCFEDYWRVIRTERFTEADPVVYHFRISTQAGVNPYMTQPFALTNNLAITEALDILAPAGIAHNGIIPATTDPREKRYSDTALFVAGYLADVARRPENLDDPKLRAKLEKLIGWSKLAILYKNGQIATVGHFTQYNGLLLSNLNHVYSEPVKRYTFAWNF